MSESDTATVAVDATYRAFGKAASYTPPGGSAVSPITVIQDQRDLDLSGFSGRPMMQGDVIEVRKSEVAAPVAGGVFVPGVLVSGVFVPGATSYTIVGDPKSEDPDRLVWTCVVR